MPLHRTTARASYNPGPGTISHPPPLPLPPHCRRVALPCSGALCCPYTAPPLDQLDPRPALITHPPSLRLVWDQLVPDQGLAPVDQHALRCCCLALRDASTAWIDSMRIQVLPNATRPALITRALAQLSRFPHRAAMHKLAWSYECEEDDHDAYEQARGLVPAFMLRARNQLAFLRSFTLTSVVST